MATLCSNCGGALLYSPTRHAMYCNKCGSTFKPEKVVNDSKKLLEDVDVKKASEVFGGNGNGAYDCNIYICNHCGGEIAVNGTEASTLCIYCGNPTIVFSRVTKAMRPDGVIPFSVPKSEAEMLIKMHLKKGAFIPSKIKKANPDNIRGIYIPYWIVDCEFYDAVLFKGKKKEGKNDRTTYAAQAGYSTFTNLPVDASLRLNDEICKRLEPFYFEDAKAFDEDYLSGFYSDSTDMTVSDLRKSVLLRCDELFTSESKRDIPLTNLEQVRSTPYADIKDSTVYLMVPAWFYTFTYGGKPHTILVNGQTGKTVGALPFDKAKAYTLGAVIFTVLSLIFLIPYFRLDPNIRFHLMKLYLTYLLTFGIMIMGVAVAKVKHFTKMIRSTQSGSTFVYVKKRQE